MVARLRRFFDIRPGEGLPVLLSFTYIGVVIASYVLARAIRNGLFIEAYGPYALVYVAADQPGSSSRCSCRRTPALAGAARRPPGHHRAPCSSSASTSWCCGTRSGHEPTPRLTAIFYVWVNCFGVIAPVHAWSYASSLFDTRQAKRLFGLIGSGASLGAIVGGFLARTLVEPLGGSINLLLVLALLIALAAAVVAVANTRIRRRGAMRLGRGHERARPLQTARSHPGQPVPAADRRGRVPDRDRDAVDRASAEPGDLARTSTATRPR